MKETNDRSIRISGKSYIEKDFNLGDEVEVTGKGSIIKIETLDNEDGTQSVVFTIKFFEVTAK